jgi:hypothetical protein
MKLTPNKVKQLAYHIEKQMDDSGYEHTPLNDTIAWWIAEWCRDQMEAEGKSFFLKVTAE